VCPSGSKVLGLAGSETSHSCPSLKQAAAAASGFGFGFASGPWFDSKMTVMSWQPTAPTSDPSSPALGTVSRCRGGSLITSAAPGAASGTATTEIFPCGRPLARFGSPQLGPIPVAASGYDDT
jgi:hypothetical protein